MCALPVYGSLFLSAQITCVCAFKNHNGPDILKPKQNVDNRSTLSTLTQTKICLLFMIKNTVSSSSRKSSTSFSRVKTPVSPSYPLFLLNICFTLPHTFICFSLTHKLKHMSYIFTFSLLIKKTEWMKQTIVWSEWDVLNISMSGPLLRRNTCRMIVHSLPQ